MIYNAYSYFIFFLNFVWLGFIQSFTKQQGKQLKKKYIFLTCYVMVWYQEHTHFFFVMEGEVVGKVVGLSIQNISREERGCISLTSSLNLPGTQYS